MKSIYFIVDHGTHKFHFFEDWTEAKTKEKELTLKYGPNRDSAFPKLEIPPCPVQIGKLNHYYGTIWLCYKWNESGTVNYLFKGRWKDIKIYQEDGYKIDKIVLTPYEEYTAPKEPEPRMSESKIDYSKIDLTGLGDD